MPIFVCVGCVNLSRHRVLKLCLKVQDRHSSAPSARSWCFQMSHRRGDPELPYDQQCHGFVQVVKRLTAMASHEESDLFDLYSKVSCPVESYQHVRPFTSFAGGITYRIEGAHRRARRRTGSRAVVESSTAAVFADHALRNPLQGVIKWRLQQLL